MNLIPSKKQYKSWSLPSKLTFFGFWIGLIGVVLTIVFQIDFKTKPTSKQLLAKDWNVSIFDSDTFELMDNLMDAHFTKGVENLFADDLSKEENKYMMLNLLENSITIRIMEEDSIQYIFANTLFPEKTAYQLVEKDEQTWLRMKNGPNWKIEDLTDSFLTVSTEVYDTIKKDSVVFRMSLIPK